MDYEYLDKEVVIKYIKFNNKHLQRDLNNFINHHTEDYKGDLSIKIVSIGDDDCTVKATWSNLNNYSKELLGVLMLDAYKYQTIPLLNEIKENYNSDIEIDILGRIFINNYESKLILSITRNKELNKTLKKL